MAQIGEHSTTDFALEYLESLLAGTATSEMRRTVFAASAISTGGSFSLQLLAHVVITNIYYLLSHLTDSRFHQTGQSLNSIVKIIDTFAQEARIFAAVAPLPVFGETDLASTSASLADGYAFTKDHANSDGLQRPPESDLFGFTHDQLQQAAKELLPVSQRALTHAHIGGAMLSLLSPAMDEALLQTLVYNLNESRRLGFHASKDDDLLLVKLNIRVARVNVRSFLPSTIDLSNQIQFPAAFCGGSSSSSELRAGSANDRRSAEIVGGRLRCRTFFIGGLC